MSKILSIFLRAMIVVVLPLALSSCCLIEMEQVFFDELRIENKLAIPIIYCNEFDATTCSEVVQSGGSYSVIFVSHVDNDSDEERLESFDRQNIKVCGKVLDIKLIRSVSPIVKRDKDHSEIIIDRAVSDKFCQQ